MCVCVCVCVCVIFYHELLYVISVLLSLTLCTQYYMVEMEKICARSHPLY